MGNQMGSAGLGAKIGTLDRMAFHFRLSDTFARLKHQVYNDNLNKWKHPTPELP